MSIAPLLFVGHGSPMNALGGNPYMDAWLKLGARLPALSGILCISAHWETGGTKVSTCQSPETIHDFYGFPKELYAIAYPAPGATALAGRVQALLGPDCGIDPERGLDHGAWCPLLGLSPSASIPVAQLSLSRKLDPAGHAALAAQLSPLRDEGVLILGSGDGVHNLRIMREGKPYPWASRIDAELLALMRERHGETGTARNEALARLADYAAIDPEMSLAVPTQEHYLPLLYVAALVRPDESVEIFTQAIEYGSVSMTGYAFGLGA